MNATTFELIDHQVKSVVRSYARRTPKLSFDDAYQEAWLAVVSLLRRTQLAEEDIRGAAFWRAKTGARRELNFAGPVSWGPKTWTTRLDVDDLSLGVKDPDGTARIDLRRLPEEILQRLFRVLVLRESQIDVYCASDTSVIGSRKSRGSRDFFADLKKARRLLHATNTPKKTLHNMRKEKRT